LFVRNGVTIHSLSRRCPPREIPYGLLVGSSYLETAMIDGTERYHSLAIRGDQRRGIGSKKGKRKIPRRLLISLPVHNEAQILENAVKAVHSALRRQSLFTYRILVIDDGSTDGTGVIADSLSHAYPELNVVHFAKRLGRGASIREAWMMEHADIYAYIDCDLATDMVHLGQLLRAIFDGYDLATGSRYLRGSVVRRPFLRWFVSIAYNLLVRLLFRDGVRDHQCGFKAFSMRLIDEVLPLTRSNHWFWDTEIIVLATRRGFKVKELGVIWQERRYARTRLARLIHDIAEHSLDLLRLCMRLEKSEIR